MAEPLERGFGLTLGNALRRVLLSSLQGAAIIGVQIDNVVHEFSAIQGVREDVTTIVLNLKQVAVTMNTRDTAELRVSKKGPGPVTAGDIQLDHDVEIMNPDQVLMHLDEGAHISMELTVENTREPICIFFSSSRTRSSKKSPVRRWKLSTASVRDTRATPEVLYWAPP